MRSIGIVSLLLLGAAVPAAAQEDVTFGLRAGVVDVDCFETEAGCLDADMSPNIGGSVEYGILGPFSLGLYADVHGLTGDFDGREYMLDLGGALKAQIGGPSARAFLRPGIGVGYGTVDVGDGAQLLTTRATVEVVIPQVGGLSWMFEGGAYMAPKGDADGTDVEFGPGLILRAGILF
ncbi:MAG TPA: outer membrane beta-barrel protein [Longimicrobiales bacterium]|nr:outer membrane beta-barrel protein [Longimicrobiales bacterium]